MNTLAFLQLTAMHDELRSELDGAWHRVSRSCNFIGGEFVEQFEAEWAEYCGTRYCVGVANGTAALQLSFAALGIGRGDEVILPAFTFFATAEAVFAVGARPIFVDVDPSTLLLSARAVRAAITSRTAAIVAVHLYGQPADMDALGEVARATGIAVVEDAAQAHGATWRGRRAGSLSAAGCFSFYPGKNLGAVGDAGAVVTDDANLADQVRALSNHGRPLQSHYRHAAIGNNFRLDALQAAILSVKLKRLDAWNARRERAAAWYKVHLAGLPLEHVQIAGEAHSSHHLAVVRTRHRDVLRDRLAAAGIATGIHYPIPCHRQPAIESDRPSCPAAEMAAETVLSLPMHPHLAEADVVRVADTMRSILADLEPSGGSMS
jgi:dTDP-4-amino-4,6-dideoxygalactose transaminase